MEHAHCLLKDPMSVTVTLVTVDTSIKLLIGSSVIELNFLER